MQAMAIAKARAAVTAKRAHVSEGPTSSVTKLATPHPATNAQNHRINCP